MADAKITALTAGTPALGDLIPFVDDPGGSPVTKKAAIEVYRPIVAPAAACALAKSGNHTSHGTPFTYTIISWTSADVDTDSFWSGGAPTRITVPSGLDGLYLVSAAVGHDQGSSRTVDVSILKNGTTSYGFGRYTGNSGMAWAHFPLILVATDYIEIQTQSGTASQALTSYMIKVSFARVAG